MSESGNEKSNIFRFPSRPKAPVRREESELERLRSLLMQATLSNVDRDRLDLLEREEKERKAE